MQKNRKKSIILCAVMLGFAHSALATEAQDAVVGPGSQPVRNERFGTCVVTKWTAASDPCAAPKAVAIPTTPPPAPVAQQPVTQLQHEELTIYFDFNKAALTEESTAKLDKIVDAVKRSPKVIKVDIVGYTDEIGSNDYNKTLSEQRAEAAKVYLTSKVNIPVGVMELQGLGKANPVASCKNTKKRVKKIACMAKDRRVEIAFEFRQ